MLEPLLCGARLSGKHRGETGGLFGPDPAYPSAVAPCTIAGGSLVRPGLPPKPGPVVPSSRLLVSAVGVMVAASIPELIRCTRRRDPRSVLPRFGGIRLARPSRPRTIYPTLCFGHTPAHSSRNPIFRDAELYVMFREAIESSHGAAGASRYLSGGNGDPNSPFR
jgi:hypothetical protein